MEKIIHRKIRIAVVGCGRISKNHFGSIEQHQEKIELVSICDNRPDILSEYEKKYKVKGYLDQEDMLKNEDLDLVALCTPSGKHAEQTELCAKYKINVITEKPMATRWEDGVRMVKACDRAGVKLLVVKQNRRNPTLQLLKRAIIEKRFGKIHMVQTNVFWNRPQKYYDQDSWRGTWKLDGGAFMNQASHYVDLLDWLIGPIDKIHSMLSTFRNIEVEDTGVLNIKWRNGALGSMSVTMLTHDKNFEGSITIIGESGCVRVGGIAVNEIQYWNFKKKKNTDNKILKYNYKIKSVYGQGHRLYYQNVANVLNGKSKALTDGNEGLKSLKILAAIYMSYKKNRVIKLAH